MQYKNYYKILGISKKASQDTIKKAYRKLAVKFHPDKNPDDKNAEEQFKEINEAYDVLKDPDKRNKYDLLGDNWKQYSNTETNQRANFDWWPYNHKNSKSSFHSGENPNNIFGETQSNFSDFFKTFFGNMGEWNDLRNPEHFFSSGKKKPEAPNQKYRLNLSLNEVYWGTSKILNINGEKLKINIKPGAYNGQELRIKRNGIDNITGYRKEDLFLKIHINIAPDQQIENHHLIIKRSIDLYTAILGGKLQITTPGGKINISIPRGTQPGTILRLKGKGLPLYGEINKFGDLLIRIKIHIPEQLTPEESKLFQKLRDLNQKN